MITTVINQKHVPIPVEEFLKLLEIMENEVHASVWKKFWCDGKELNVECILDSLKFK